MERSLLNKRVKIAAIILAICTILFIIYYQLNSSNRLLQNERESLKYKIDELNDEIKKVKVITFKTKQTRDS
jgi:membrane-anchored glycerophosphoryl diester phosphodiesterase (GDPDase)